MEGHRGKPGKMHFYVRLAVRQTINELACKILAKSSLEIKRCILNALLK